MDLNYYQTPLCPMDSREYQDLLADDSMNVLKALRTSRA
jgi:hypothetical protein